MRLNGNIEGYYISLNLAANNEKNILNSFDEYLRNDDRILKFFTIETDKLYEKEESLYDKISKLDETDLFKGIAKEFVEQIEVMHENGFDTKKINLENIKNLTNKFINTDYIWGEINNLMTDMITEECLDNKKLEEESEEDCL